MTENDRVVIFTASEILKNPKFFMKKLSRMNKITRSNTRKALLDILRKNKKWKKNLRNYT